MHLNCRNNFQIAPLWTQLLWNKTALFLFSLTPFDRNKELLKEQNKMRGKKFIFSFPEV